MPGPRGFRAEFYKILSLSFVYMINYSFVLQYFLTAGSLDPSGKPPEGWHDCIIMEGIVSYFAPSTFLMSVTQSVDSFWNYLQDIIQII